MLSSLLGLAGSLFSRAQSRRDAKQVNAAAEAQAARQEAAQREFAQSGIQWRVEDAKKAGIHPIYALGAQTASYSPVNTAFSSPGSVDYGAHGQDLGRAISSTMDGTSRTAAIAAKLSLENQELQNEYLRSQIAASKLATLNQAGIPSGVPSVSSRMLVDGQASSGAVATTPMARQSSAPGKPSQEAGAVSEYGFVRTPSGYAPVMSKDAKDRLEEDLIGVMAWNLRNRVLPTFLPQIFGNPPDHAEGYRYNPLKQQYDEGRSFLGLQLY